ncbi:MAG: hypothetical protein LCH81_01940 [Bacteroidetes bacterium]|nr:hypothetical protein [Bacteroidota bacterium]
MDIEPLDQPEQRPPDPNPPAPIGKAVMINFGIMLAYMVLTGLAYIGDRGSEAGLGSLIMDAVLLTVQVGANILIGALLLFSNNKHIGKAMLLSGLLLAVIGFGTCFLKASMY